MKYPNRSVLAAAATGLLVAFSCPVSANLITNGSFESPELAPGSDYLVVPVGAVTIPGWDVSGPGGSRVAIVESLYDLPDGAGIDFTPPDGLQLIDMTGDASNTNEGLSQTVATAPGAYVLTFYLGNIVAPVAGLGTESTVDLLIDGSVVQSFTNSDTGGTTINWQQFTFGFTAGRNTTIEFRNADPFNDNFNGLDDVVLVTAPLLEPEGYALMLGGLLALGAVARSSRNLK